MIRNLPQSLIETSRQMVIKIRSGPPRIYGPHMKIHIRGDGYRFENDDFLLEAIQDWFRDTGRRNPHEFSDLADEHFKSLTPEEINSIKAYTYNSDPIEHHVLNDHEGDEVHIDDGFIAHISHLDSALSKNKLKTDLVTYSGLKHSPIENNPAIGFVHSKSYISSTTDPVVAHNFATSYGNKISHIARIHNKKGSTGLYIGHNRDLTHSPLEFEYIIPKETSFRIGLEPEEVKDKNGVTTHHIWDFYRG